MYDAVIFDNDGVLVTPTDLEVLREATREAFAVVGVDAPDPEHVDALTHGVRPSTLTAATAPYDLDPKTFWRVRDRFSAHAQKQEVIAGRKRPYDDVAALSRITAPLGVVSSNQQDTVDFLLAHCDLREHFEAVHGRKPTLADLERKKPATHYLRRALRDLDAETALFVGDSDADLRAARSLGVDSAFVRRPHRADHEPAVEPTVEVDSLSAVPALDDVPTHEADPACARVTD